MSKHNLVILAGAACLPFVSHAQIVTDGSTGAQVTLNDLDVEVGESLGSRAGNNLFHSFETFNIQIGGSATFTGSSEITNVISRVTGGDVSNIQGVLSSTVGDADFYFINPAGVTFSEGGSVDVPASFHLSTADELRFDDGAVFSSSSSATSVLSIAAPEAFGFLGDGTGSINLDNGSVTVGGLLDFGTQESITLSAGNIAVSNSSAVVAPGAISIGAVGDGAANYDLQTGADQLLDGDVTVNGLVGFDLFSQPDNLLIEAGSINVSEASSGLLSGPEGGMRLVSRDLNISDNADVVGLGTIDIETTNQVTILNGARVGSSVLFGAGGNVAISAGRLVIDGEGSDRSTGVFSQVLPGEGGTSGDIEITIEDTALIENGGTISNSNFGVGDAGNIVLSARELVIDSQGNDDLTAIFSGVLGQTGSGGDIELNIAENVILQDGGRIGSTTTGEGNAGNISVTAGQLTIDRQESSDITGITSGTFLDATGNAGSVEVSVTEGITVQNNGRISSDTSSAGDAGDVEVQVGGLATLQNGGNITSDTTGTGAAGNVALTAGQLTITQGTTALTGVFSDTESTGDAGDINVQVSELITLQDGGMISSDTSDAGASGAVTVTAGQLTISQGTELFTGIFSNQNAGSTGSAGGVNVNVAELTTIQSGGTISSNSRGAGDAGGVVVETGQLFIDREGVERFTGIFSDSGLDSTGNGGSISVSVAEEATIQGGSISSSTFTTGEAGSVNVVVGGLATLQDGGTIRSDTFGQGNAGTVEVTVAGDAALLNGGFISSTSFSDGDAGDVRLIADGLLIDNSGAFLGVTGVDSSAVLESSGEAGSVEVFITGITTIRSGGRITSDAFAVGNAGSVNVESGSLLIDAQGSTTFTGISSETLEDATGNAGSVEVTVAELTTIQNGGQINSSTRGEGNAGSVVVSTQELILDGQDTPITETATGILSTSGGSSNGNAGTVVVNVEDRAIITSDGVISTSALLEGEAGNVTINSTSGTIVLADNGSIGSFAEGTNRDSGSVTIDSGGLVVVEGSSISTQSIDGESGAISITAGTLSTNEALIVTTSQSQAADGGDITINSDVFALQTTVVQANAVSGRGGEITVDASVIPFGEQLDTQLDTPISLDDPQIASFGNVAQAVAPTGLTLPPVINSPEVDVSGSLTDLDQNLLDTPNIAADPCAANTAGVSTLVEYGRGALPQKNVASVEVQAPSDTAQVWFHEVPKRIYANAGDANSGCRAGNVPG